MNKKKIIISLLLLWSISFLFAGGQKEKPAQAAAEPEAVVETEAKTKAGTPIQTVPLIDKIAKVNDEYINAETLDTETGRYRTQYQAQGYTLDEEQLLKLKASVLQSLINQRLLVQEFDSLQMEIDQDALEKEFIEFRNQFATDSDFLGALNAQGYSEETLRGIILDQYKMQSIVDYSAKDVVLDEAEIQEYYDGHPEDFQQPESVRAAHILVTIDENATEDEKASALARIMAVQERLKNGEDFSKLAGTESDCPSSANGGDLGFFQKGQMVQPFEDAAWNLGINETSGIIETQFGYHIIRKYEHKNASTVGLTEVHDSLSGHLLEQKQMKEFQTYILALREKSKIEIFPPELRIE